MQRDGTGPPRVIYIIRHAEKPESSHGTPFGVDADGRHNDSSLTPRGWQRAGALAALFAPVDGRFRPGLARPDRLISLSYGKTSDTGEHRAHQTILPLGERLRIAIDSPYEQGEEAQAIRDVLATASEVTLISWEHKAISDLVAAIPSAPGNAIPAAWPDDRFDLVWRFELDLSSGSPHYHFSQIPQQLLAGDLGSVAPATPSTPRRPDRETPGLE